MDFYKIVERSKRDEIEIYPDFKVGHVKDLLVRGKSFYAIWDERKGMWSKDILDVSELVDRELWEYAEKLKNERNYQGRISVKTMESFSSGSWLKFTTFLSKYSDCDIQLDSKLTFANTPVERSDYVSRRLPYSLEPGDYSAWDELVGRLYEPQEREKIEWAIGSVVSGDSKKIQKFCVFYGEPGTGKGTIIDVIQRLFDGYYVTFDAKALASSNNQFSTEVFRSNPLVAIQHDGDLSRIEDNTKLNSIISHEEMVINEKNKPQYTSKANCFLFLGTNRPVKITDGKSGIIRRLIDISPSGKTFTPKEYETLMSQIDFQLGAIAYHCLEVYRELGKNYYKTYIPKTMIMKTDVFYNFVEARLDVFENQDGITLKQAYSMYKEYCDEALVEFKLPRHRFREELKNYYISFDDLARVDGKQIRSWYSGFRRDKMEPPVLKREQKPLSLIFDCTESLLDKELADCPAQYADIYEAPLDRWCDVNTKLSCLDTSRLHYILPKMPEGHPPLIMIDFDQKNEKGEKDILKNLESASMWPKTYGELSKSGSAVHLIYWYDGDISKIQHLFAKDIEVKTFVGNSSMRRKLTKCNDIPIATLHEGSLPLKEEKMIDFSKLNDERHIRNILKKCLRKENHGATGPEVDLINKVLNDAYMSGMKYDVSDMKKDIRKFAENSTNQHERCVKVVEQMHFCDLRTSVIKIIASKTITDPDRKLELIDILLKDADGNGLVYDIEDLRHDIIYEVACSSTDLKSNQVYIRKVNGLKLSNVKKEPQKVKINEYGTEDDITIIFFDCEVFPNLFVICWKVIGDKQPVHRMINPSPADVEAFLTMGNVGLVGFNCRKYDNHIVYGRYLGYSNSQLFDLSQRIIVDGAKDAFFTDAYDLSYTDIYDFCSKKQGLKKWEIELGIHHQEFGLPWDQEVPENLWETVAEYCENDVLATEAVWNARQADWTARKILADIAGGKPNDTTNQLSTKFIFGDNKSPQSEFNYRNMGDVSDSEIDISLNDRGIDPEYTRFDSQGRPVFPGYSYELGKSSYRGEIVGEGGYVYAEKGIWTNVALLDIASMHPSSIVAENLFGDRYTKRFKEILDIRIAIKHKEFDRAREMLDGKLLRYLTDESSAKDLAQALKIVINSVYGLTSAKFKNPFRDIRNVDNIVAKRGALFMVNLKHEVQRRGFTVAHIKTDSIKIPNATNDIIQFVIDYGKMYGYNFEHEATYDRMCLVNDAVYIAKYKDGDWTATGAEFQHPYIFKMLFSGEPITFEDLCETKNVTGGAIYLDMNEDLMVDIPAETEMERRVYNKAHPDKVKKLNPTYVRVKDDELSALISKGHDYHFVGRTGLFCPIKKGCGGGWMVRLKDGKYYSVTGTKDIRWLESETVKILNKQDDIDEGYFEKLIDDAVASIDEVGGKGAFERFVDVSQDYIPVAVEMANRGSEGLLGPFSCVPCGDGKFNSCMDCPGFVKGKCSKGYELSDYIFEGG